MPSQQTIKEVAFTISTYLSNPATIKDFLTLPIKLQLAIKTEIATRLHNPKLANNALTTLQTQLRQLVLTKHAQTQAALAPKNTLAAAQRTAHACYQQYLIEKGLAQVKQDPSLGRFETQGYLITEVTLKVTDYQQILTKLKAKLPEQPTLNASASLDAKATLMKFMGSSTLTDTTYCSLDIQGLAPRYQLPEKYHAWLTGEPLAPISRITRNVQPRSSFCLKPLTARPISALKKPYYQALMNSEGRSTIISLQLEAEMHLRLNARVLEKAWAEKSPQTFTSASVHLTQIHQQAARTFNRDVIQPAYKAALITHYDHTKKTLDLKGLNKSLDESRLLIKAHAQKILLDTYKAALSDTEFSAMSDVINDQKNFKNKAFESITATPDNYLRSDARNGTCAWYAGTDFTSHDKKIGELAKRAKYSHAYRLDKQGEPCVDNLGNDRFEMRTPSIAVTDHVSAEQAIKDVAAKMRSLSLEIEQQSGGYDGPISYCLLTSLSSKSANLIKSRTGDEQRLSASYILKGSHLFNRQQLESGRHEQFCFVQNIPINQHGCALSHNHRTAAIREATLMAELSLLSLLTLKTPTEHLSASLQELIIAFHDVKALYKEYLTQANSPAYFCQSKSGIQAKAQLAALKACLKTTPNPATVATGPGKCLEQLVLKALQTVLTHDLHLNLQYGMLIQALTVFAQRACFYGCKSANERYMAVSNRCELLDGIEMRIANDLPLSEKETAFIQALEQFTQTTTQPGLRETQHTLDCAYNLHGLQTAAAMISYQDQGSGAKVQHSEDGLDGQISEVNTNMAETKEVDYLWAKHAGDNQAHKAKLADGFRKTLIEHHAFYQAPCTTTPVGAIDKAASTLESDHPAHRAVCIIKSTEELQL